MALTDKLTAIADAIRGKTGKTDGLTLDAMPGEIAGIQTGGGGGSNVQVFTGEYTHVGSGAAGAYQLRFTHNFGEIKPFAFYMEAIGDEFPNDGDNTIHQLYIFVPKVEAGNTITVNGTAYTMRIPRTAFASIYMNGNGGDTSFGTLNIVDAPGSSGNYRVDMWENGFMCGLYRNLSKTATYRYTLLWGLEL